MKKVAVVLAILAAIIGVAIVLYRLAYPTYTYRYRMTVNVDTPQGLRSGSSVIESRFERFPEFNGYSSSAKARGEAVFVDLGKGRQVIALLAAGRNGANVDYPQWIIFSTFNVDVDKNDQMRALERSTDSKVLPPKEYPTFVTFGDLNDPMTARVVPLDEFENVFGAGVKLRDVTIEMTKDAVTRGIEAKLPWWKNQGRPASLALRAASLITGAGIDAESAFRRNSR